MFLPVVIIPCLLYIQQICTSSIGKNDTILTNKEAENSETEKDSTYHPKIDTITGEYRTKNGADIEGINSEEKILADFDRIKENRLKMQPVTGKKALRMLECEVARHLGTYRTAIYKIRKGLGKNKNKSYAGINQRKAVENFDKIKQKMAKENPEKPGSIIAMEAADEIGINLSTIYAWASNNGLTFTEQRAKKQKIFKENEKLAKMEKYFALKAKNPEFTDEALAYKLDISITSLIKWRKAYKKEWQKTDN